MKRYLAFAGDNYYPDGGWEDFRGDFDTCEEAVAAVKNYKPTCSTGQWGHVVYTETKEIVHEQ